MKLFKTSTGNILKSNGQSYLIEEGWDLLINREDLFKYLNAQVSTSNPLSEEEAAYLIAASIEAPIGTQEVWAAGVTYLRSRDARMEES
ncbi:MAG: 2-hydroxyhepta-2,4-diene-1,7-dioate isomerase, partial [Ginsengibacter sp.]